MQRTTPHLLLLGAQPGLHQRSGETESPLKYFHVANGEMTFIERVIIMRSGVYSISLDDLASAVASAARQTKRTVRWL